MKFYVTNLSSLVAKRDFEKNMRDVMSDISHRYLFFKTDLDKINIESENGVISLLQDSTERYFPVLSKFDKDGEHTIYGIYDRETMNCVMGKTPVRAIASLISIHPDMQPLDWERNRVISHQQRLIQELLYMSKNGVYPNRPSYFTLLDTKFRFELTDENIDKAIDALKRAIIDQIK